MIEKRKSPGAGFTLVELVVVIAILGILSGVAIPVYGGYIGKAQEAADMQLLGAVNTAWAAACAEQTVDPTKVTASAMLDSEGKVSSVKPAALNDSFFAFFGENADTPFQVYKSIVYNKADGVFRGTDWDLSYDAETGVYSVTNSKGETITVTEANRAALLNSTFGTAMDIGELMDDIDFVAAAAGGVFEALSGGAAEVAGILDGTADSGEFHDLLTTLGLGDDATGEELANAVVLLVAQKTQSLTTDQLKAFAFSGGSGDSSNIFSGSGAAPTAARAALSYALATGFVNSQEGRNATLQLYNYLTDEEYTMSAVDYYNSVNDRLMNGEIDGGTALQLVNTMWTDMYYQYGDNTEDPQEAVTTYLTNHGDADVAGYLASMQTIAQNVSNIDGSTYASEGMRGNYMSEILGLLYN